MDFMMRGVFVALCLGVLLPLGVLAETPGSSPDPAVELLAQSPYREAVFEYSDEPSKVLVFVSSTGMSGYQRTMALHGNGQLVLRKLRGGEVLEEAEAHLEKNQVEQILRLVVDHGLAEWDLTRVQGKQLEKNSGKLYSAIPSDATRDTVLISLAYYERGELRRHDLERKVRFLGASVADRLYPPILEIRGIVELKRALRAAGEAEAE